MLELKNPKTININIDDKNYEICDKKHLNGYIYDSLMYRYIRAREKMALYEFQHSPNKTRTVSYYYDIAQRDILRFAAILDEAIGEHD